MASQEKIFATYGKYLQSQRIQYIKCSYQKNKRETVLLKNNLYVVYKKPT